ncbi:unnamed protein product [Moneuplotes crassus]|uniref:Uncharacterized protein n=1 Tax=Euplotes crassus TaxID=5936 RepID=A0AAD2D9J9_EUPCR|nr:unnamed protein product [Moneuplotes crassus]
MIYNSPLAMMRFERHEPCAPQICFKLNPKFSKFKHPNRSLMNVSMEILN